MASPCNGIVFSLKMGRNSDTYYNMHDPWGHICAQRNKPVAKDKHCITPLTQGPYRSHIHRDRKQNGICQGPGDGELVFNGKGFQFCKMKSILEVKVGRVAQPHAKRHIKVFTSLTEQMPIQWVEVVGSASPTRVTGVRLGFIKKVWRRSKETDWLASAKQLSFRKPRGVCDGCSDQVPVSRVQVLTLAEVLRCLQKVPFLFNY